MVTPILRGDRGSMLPLVAGLVALCGTVVIGVIGVADLALTRTNLQSIADVAALAAADSIDPTLVTVNGETLDVRLTRRGVRLAAAAFLRESGSLARLRLARTRDGVTAEITVRTVWTPPVVSEFIPLRIPLDASASARSVFGVSD